MNVSQIMWSIADVVGKAWWSLITHWTACCQNQKWIVSDTLKKWLSVVIISQDGAESSFLLGVVKRFKGIFTWGLLQNTIAITAPRLCHVIGPVYQTTSHLSVTAFNTKFTKEKVLQKRTNQAVLFSGKKSCQTTHASFGFNVLKILILMLEIGNVTFLHWRLVMMICRRCSMKMHSNVKKTCWTVRTITKNDF